MDLELTGKRALVAAASRGLGAAIARSLAIEGCIVEISSRSLNNAADTAARIVLETGGTVTSAQVDVSDPGAVESWVIPNAGGPPSAFFSDTGQQEWDTAYALILRSAMAFARASRPHLTRGGTILFMTSTSVREPIGALSMSNIFRAGVAALAKTLANDWASDGIRVNHLIPGRISTERLIDLDAAAAQRLGIEADEVRSRNEKAIPLGRYGEPNEFASAATFLVSSAASYITGATLQVDGGAIQAVV